MAEGRQSESTQSPAGSPGDHAFSEDAKLKPDSSATAFALDKKIRAVKELASLDAFPAAAREREIAKAAHTFASTGRNIFVHYVEPTLSARRRRLLASGTIKRTYHKSAAQLWQVQNTDQRAFWEEKARELRMCMKQGLLSAEDCIRDAGKRGEVQSYLWYAESTVATYLGLPQPESFSVVTVADRRLLVDDRTPTEIRGTDSEAELNISKQAMAIEKYATAAGQVATVIEGVPAHESHGTHVLLDTLPDRFECDRKTMYEPFALFDFDQIRTMEGKQQVAELRRIADMMHKSGKDLFHHYMFPRLCKALKPPVNGDTVASVSADIWRFLSGVARGEWLVASRDIKQQLGNGDVLGLDRIRLDGADAEVFQLHSLAETALESHMASRKISTLVKD